MRWSSSQVSEDDDGSSSAVQMDVAAAAIHSPSTSRPIPNNCPSCGHNIEELQLQNQLQGGGIIRNLASDLPSGVKFDPNDQEILEHLEAKVLANHLHNKLHPLIHEFIPTLEGDNGICYTHPQKLPGVSKDGQVRHFFHRPSKAYTTGTRKRRKVHSDDHEDGDGETRWHKTGKTRPVVVNGTLKGFKKILVLYTNYGRQRKPEKTNWVMHQYHIGHSEDEKDGEMVVSKVFYQTQPRQQQSSSAAPAAEAECHPNPSTVVEYFQQNNTSNHQPLISYHHQQGGGEMSSHFLHIHGGGANSSLIRFATDSTNEERIS